VAAWKGSSVIPTEGIGDSREAVTSGFRYKPGLAFGDAVYEQT
jgi:hypothetical protein